MELVCCMLMRVSAIGSAPVIIMRLLILLLDVRFSGDGPVDLFANVVLADSCS